MLMIELDAVSLPFVRAHLDRLPNFRRLLQDGAVLETESPGHIASASVWPTFMSGLPPGHHGHYFPFQWHAEHMAFSRTNKKRWSNAIDFEPFWYDIARRGIACMVLDPTQILPHADVPCLEIVNWSTQSTGRAFASEPVVLKQLRRRFGRRPIGKEVQVAKTRPMTEAIRRRAIQALKKKTDALIWLAAARDWQFFLVSFHELHRAGHNLWPDPDGAGSDAAPDALLDVYRAFDTEIARILRAVAVNDTTVLFFSLHGMAANRAQNHFMPHIMNRLNTLYVSGKAQFAPTESRPGLTAKLRDRLPPSVQYAAAASLGEDIQDWVVNREFVGGLDWSATPAFAVPTGGEGMIRLSLKGRERYGFLPDHDQAVGAYVDWLRDRLLCIKVKSSDEPLIDAVNLVRHVFPGPRHYFLPDIALHWAPKHPVTEIYSDDIGEIRVALRTGRGGNHTGDSFAILAGTGSTEDRLPGLRHITDYKTVVERFFGGPS